MRRNRRQQQYTNAFDKNCLLRLEEARQTTEEEGSKEEDRREGADVKKRKKLRMNVNIFKNVSIHS